MSSVVLNEGLVGIERWAFYGCSVLNNITLPGTLETIGQGAFSSCSSLTSLTIPSGTTKIESSAFMFCSSLQSLEVPIENINYSSEEGVLFNKEKTTIVCYPAGKTDTSYTLPESVTLVGTVSFFNVKNLTQVILPESVNYIEALAFSRASNITEILIPEAVTYIGSEAFKDCTSLAALYIMRPSSQDITEGSSNFLQNTSTSLVIYVPDSTSQTAYQNDYWWNGYSGVIQVQAE